MFRNYIFRYFKKICKNIINYCKDFLNYFKDFLDGIEPGEIIQVYLLILLLDFFANQKVPYLKDIVIAIIVVAFIMKVVNRKRMKKN